MRAVYRSQASFVAALDEAGRRSGARGCDLDHRLLQRHPEDAQLLVSFRREDLVRTAPEGPLADELAELGNRPVVRAVVNLARQLYGAEPARRWTEHSWSSSIFPTAPCAVPHHGRAGAPEPEG